MMSSARIFNCLLCHRQVIICSCCDRGNIYCGPDCAQKARKASLHAAGKLYQSTRRGKFNHARRQSCYREQAKKVTHHGSFEIGSGGLLHPEDHELKRSDQNNDLYCNFCGCKCESLLRVDFLKTSASGFLPLGP
jgi:hypothetical protein